MPIAKRRPPTSTVIVRDPTPYDFAIRELLNVVRDRPYKKPTKLDYEEWAQELAEAADQVDRERALTRELIRDY